MWHGSVPGESFSRTPGPNTRRRSEPPGTHVFRHSLKMSTLIYEIDDFHGLSPRFGSLYIHPFIYTLLIYTTHRQVSTGSGNILQKRQVDTGGAPGNFMASPLVLDLCIFTHLYGVYTFLYIPIDKSPLQVVETSYKRGQSTVALPLGILRCPCEVWAFYKARPQNSGYHWKFLRQSPRTSLRPRTILANLPRTLFYVAKRTDDPPISNGNVESFTNVLTDSKSAWMDILWLIDIKKWKTRLELFCFNSLTLILLFFFPPEYLTWVPFLFNPHMSRDLEPLRYLLFAIYAAIYLEVLAILYRWRQSCPR